MRALFAPRRSALDKGGSSVLNTQLIGGLMIDWDKIDGGSYLWDIDAISGIDQVAFTQPVTFFVGENGSGKSTLLEAIAIAYGFNPECVNQMEYPVFQVW